MFSLHGDFRYVLEEDGSEVAQDVLEAIVESNEKVGVMMVLNDGEEWSPGEKLLLCF